VSTSGGEAPLILTLALDDETSGRIDALRRRYFPPERNKIPAHVTLFHHLPGGDLPDVEQSLTAACGKTAPFSVIIAGIRNLGRGTALGVESPRLLRLRGALAAVFADHLNAQDRQSYRPHVTIQNKVSPEAARALQGELEASLEPLQGEAVGLDLWRYLGGPWDAVRRFDFG
jgi:2'-5' RNA ligase